MRRRLQIARALINRPRMVLLDEPTTGLDPQARHAVWERLRTLRAAGATLVLTTHYMDEAAQLCDRLVIMDAGRIVRAGRPVDLVAREVGREVLELRVAPADVAALLGHLGGRARGHEVDGDLVLLFTDDAEALHAHARARPRGGAPSGRPGRRARGRLPAPHRPTPTRLSSQSRTRSRRSTCARSRPGPQTTSSRRPLRARTTSFPPPAS